MNPIKATVIIAVLYMSGLCLLSQSSYAQDASEILNQMEEVMRGDSQYAEMTMKIERPPPLQQGSFDAIVAERARLLTDPDHRAGT